MSGECKVNVKAKSELDIGGRETCLIFILVEDDPERIPHPPD